MFPGHERALWVLMTSKGTSEAYSSSGRHRGAFIYFPSVAFASTASATVVDTAAWSSEGNLATSLFHVSSFPADRGPVKRLPAANLTLAAWLNGDDARSSFSSSEASWAASRCLETRPLVNATSHGSQSRKVTRVREHYVPAFHQREPMLPLDPAVR